MTNAAVFDVDGTLVSFEFDIRGTREALLSEMARRGFDPAGLSMTSPTQKILDRASEQSSAGSGPDFQSFRAYAFALLDEFESKSSKHARVFPEATGILQRLARGGVRLAVLTNSGKRAIDDLMKRTGLSDFFEFILTRDDVGNMKPRPEGLIKAVSILDLPSNSVYYIGDSLFDVQAAKSAGVRSVSVSTGNYDAGRLKEAGTDFVLSSLKELPTVFGL